MAYTVPPLPYDYNALELADVLLREAAVGELGLGETPGDASLPQTLPERRRAVGGGKRFLARHCPVKNMGLVFT